MGRGLRRPKDCVGVRQTLSILFSASWDLAIETCVLCKVYSGIGETLIVLTRTRDGRLRSDEARHEEIA